MGTRLLLICSVVTLVSGGAIGGSKGADNNSPKTVVVQMQENRFVPDRVTIKAGDSVQWMALSDGPSHEVTDDPRQADDPRDVSSPKAAAVFDSRGIKPGRSFQFRFTVPGVYRYTCPPHATHGMNGIVVVEP